jgi:hypothetical protein
MAFLLQPGAGRYDPPGLILDSVTAALQRARPPSAERPAFGFKRISK